MIEHSRDVWRSSDILRRCPTPTSGEIVVCARARDAVDAELDDDLRFESAMDKAIREAERIPGMPTNAAYLFAPPPCIPSLLKFCGNILGPTQRTVLVDLSAIPEPLTPEEAAHVFAAESPPNEEPATSAAASPAEAP